MQVVCNIFVNFSLCTQKQILLDFDVILDEYCKLKWVESLVDAIHGQGGNKLCTYRKGKTELHVKGLSPLLSCYTGYIRPS